MTLPDQTFVEVMTLPERAKGGWFGMAFSGGSTVSSILSNFYAAGMLGENGVFAFLFDRSPENTKSTLELGSYDPANIVGNLRWVYVTNSYLWSLPLDSILVEGLRVNSGKRAILDTGTSLIMGPNAMINKIHQRLGATFYGNALYSVPCETVNDLPSISFVLGGQSFTLQSSDYILPIGDQCFSVFSPLDYRNDEGKLTWILGMSFISSFYTIFDLKRNRIGLARANL